MDKLMVGAMGVEMDESSAAVKDYMKECCLADSMVGDLADETASWKDEIMVGDLVGSSADDLACE